MSQCRTSHIFRGTSVVIFSPLPSFAIEAELTPEMRLNVVDYEYVALVFGSKSTKKRKPCDCKMARVYCFAMDFCPSFSIGAYIPQIKPYKAKGKARLHARYRLRHLPAPATRTARLAT
jgi:hypothetical protein